MSLLNPKFIFNFALEFLTDVDYGGEVPKKNAVLKYDDVSSTWKPDKTAGLQATSRVIEEDFTIEENEFLILKSPKIQTGTRLIINGQLKVV